MDPNTNSDANADDAGVPSGSEPVEEDAFDPVEVFPDGEMDLRPGADDCYKCSTCDANCPVAEVDDDFPGPKFQGPEQWRLKRKGDHDIDPSVMKCSNCMRCDDACPAGVPLSQMHNEARGEYVRQGMDRFSVEYVRNRILSNYGLLARAASTVPRLANAVMGNRLVRLFNEKVLGITAERTFPAFAEETFREWYADRGGFDASLERARAARADAGDDVGDEEGDGDGTGKRVAYFHGDYANYNTPEVARAMVRVFERYGYAVAVPDQRCSGTPMFANGMLADARRAARFNVETLAEYVDEGYDVIASCTSCSMALRQEYPELFDFEGTERVAANTYEALEYLRIREDVAADLADAEADVDADSPAGESEFAYHAPCHARNQGLDRQALELFAPLDGVAVDDVGDSCSGISGTYGWKTENYDTSMAIGEEMFEHMRAVPGETGLTECPTCAMQMEHGTGYEVRHPLEVLEAALVE